MHKPYSIQGLSSRRPASVHSTSSVAIQTGLSASCPIRRTSDPPGTKTVTRDPLARRDGNNERPDVNIPETGAGTYGRGMSIHVDNPGHGVWDRDLGSSERSASRQKGNNGDRIDKDRRLGSMRGSSGRLSINGAPDAHAHSHRDVEYAGDAPHQDSVWDEHMYSVLRKAARDLPSLSGVARYKLGGDAPMFLEYACNMDSALRKSKDAGTQVCMCMCVLYLYV
jgi:hypothetical protein